MECTDPLSIRNSVPTAATLYDGRAFISKTAFGG